MRIKIFLIFILLFTIQLTSAATLWVNDPSNCPATDSGNFSGQDCSPNKICGDNGGIAQCYDTDSLNAPSSNTTTTSNVDDGSYNGGYLLNCYATADSTSPYCDNSGSFWCDRNSTCQSTNNRQTVCLENQWGVSSCGDCRSGYLDCNADAGVCEIQTGAACGSSTGTYSGSCNGTLGACTSSTNSDCDNDDSDSILTTCNGANGCEITGGGSCGNSTGTYVNSQCLGATGNCTSVETNLDCNNDDSDSNELTCNSGDGCEIVNGSSCSVGVLSGTYSGCSGGTGNCVINKSYFETGTDTLYSTSDALLWGSQYGSGYLVNLTNGSEMMFGVNNSGTGFFNWLGSLTNFITGLFVQNINASGNVDISGNLTVDTDTLFVNSDNNRVGIGTTSPSHTLNVVGDLNVTGTSYLGDVTLTSDNITVNNILPKDDGVVNVDGNLTLGQKIVFALGGFIQNIVSGQIDINGTLNVTDNLIIEGNVTVGGDLNVSGNTIVEGNLTVDTDTLFVDSDNNRVGIGTSSPTQALDVNGSVNITGVYYGNGSGLTGIGADSFNVGSINTTHILDGTIVDADISDSTNLTLGQKIVFDLGGFIQNIVSGRIDVNGSLNVTDDLIVGGDLNVTGNVVATDYLVGSKSIVDIETPTPYGIDNTNLVGYWTGNGDAKDYSGYGNDGTLVDDANYSDGVFGGAYDFDGNGDYLEIYDGSNLEGYSDTEITFSFWIKPRDVTSDRYISCGGRLDDRNKRCLLIGYQDNYVNLYNNAYPTGNATDTQIPITQDIWQHITYTTNGSSIFGYKNGVLLINVSGNLDASAFDRYRFGADSTDIPISYFNGALDEIMIYNISLSADAVLSLYNAGNKFKTNGDSLYYDGNVSVGGDLNITGVYYGNGSGLTDINATWWAGLSGWVSGWFEQTGNSLDFNETKLNDSIENLILINSTNGIYIYDSNEKIYFNETKLNDTIASEGVRVGFNSTYNVTYDAKADYQFGSNNFNGSGNFTTSGNVNISGVYYGNGSQLNTNSSTWWAGLSGWVSGWLIQNGNNLDFNETKLNATIASEGVRVGFNSTYNVTYDAKADYQFGSNNFNGSGNFTTSGKIESPEIYSSGLEWTNRTLPVGHQLVDITYGDGLFVAVAGNGTGDRVLTSPDGVTWTNRTSAGDDYWTGVTYGNGLFVAVSQGGTVMSSPDGITWTGRTPAAATLWQGITYGNGLFVAVSQTGSNNRVMTSPDGITWTSRDAATDSTWRNVAYGDGLFVAIGFSGVVMTSPNGTDWESGSTSASNSFGGITYGNGLFVAVSSDGANRVMTSSDGVAWTDRDAAADSTWQSVTYGDGLFVAVAGSGANRVMTSSDGITWINRTSPEDNNWGGVAYGNGVFVAVSTGGANHVMTSGKPEQYVTPTNNIFQGGLDVRGDLNVSGVYYGNGSGLTGVANYEFGSNNFNGSGNFTTSGDINLGNTNGKLILFDSGLGDWIGTTDGNSGEIGIMSRQLIIMHIDSDNDAIDRYFAINKDSNVIKGGTELFRVQENGNVGIGTSSPTQALDVNGSVNISGVIYGNGSGLTGIGDAYYQFGSNNFNGSGNFTTSGRVGIGTTNPTTELEVVGDITSKGTSWTSRTSAADNAWLGMAYGNGLFVAVAANAIMTSPDGITWTNRASAADNNWFGVTYGNGLFVAVGWGGAGDRVMTSPDGITWTSRTAATADDWLGVTYGNGLFVAVSTNDEVMTSPDGITWTSRTGAANNEWISVTYGNDLFVAVSYTGTGDRVMTSTDGITWTSRTTSDNQWRYVTYGNGLFVAVSNTGTNRVITSPDGITWTNRTASVDNQWRSVTYGNGLFVAVASDGTNRVMTSPNGFNWTNRTAAVDNQWKAITYGNGVFVAVSDDGSSNRVMTSGKSEINVVSTNNIYQGGMNIYGNVGIGTSIPTTELEVVGDITSKGTSWTNRTSASDNSWRSVVYGNGRFVAVSNSESEDLVMTSPDGITWTNRTSASNNSWTDVTYGNGLFVAVAYTGTGNRVMTSPDGITWTNRTGVSDNIWRGITYANGLFVAVSDSGAGDLVMTSPDGITWTNRISASDNQWYDVTYGNGLFVAVGQSGSGNRVMTSPDGITWTNRTSAADSTWVGVTYGNGLFVAISDSGASLSNRVMTSPDGITWTNRTAASGNLWNNVIYGNGLFVAVSANGAGDRVMTSPDGITWTSRTSSSDNSWHDITYGNGVFVAVSTNGANRVMTSGKTERNIVPYNNIFQGGMSIFGNVGIGTSSPLAPLHINSTSNETVLRLQDSDGVCLHNPEAGSETVSCSSDKKLKKDIKNASSALEEFEDIEIKDYVVRASGQNTTGVIAQEINETHPEMVHIENGELFVEQPNPWKLLKAIQELKEMFESLIGGNYSVETKVVFDKNMVGSAKVLVNETEVEIEFNEEYEVVPIVTLTPLEFIDGQYKVSNKTTKGFNIELQKVQEIEIGFDWHAFAQAPQAYPENLTNFTEGKVEQEQETNVTINYTNITENVVGNLTEGNFTNQTEFNETENLNITLPKDVEETNITIPEKSKPKKVEDVEEIVVPGNNISEEVANETTEEVLVTPRAYPETFPEEMPTGGNESEIIEPVIEEVIEEVPAEEIIEEEIIVEEVEEPVVAPQAYPEKSQEEIFTEGKEIVETPEAAPTETTSSPITGGVIGANNQNGFLTRFVKFVGGLFS